jgi:hypothetical protein
MNTGLRHRLRAYSFPEPVTRQPLQPPFIHPDMETLLHLPDRKPPSSLVEVIQVLRDRKLEPLHDHKSWGDWIVFPGYDTVVSIESIRGLARSATIEHADPEETELVNDILAAFGKLGWWGREGDEEFALA